MVSLDGNDIGIYHKPVNVKNIYRIAIISGNSIIICEVEHLAGILKTKSSIIFKHCPRERQLLFT